MDSAYATSCWSSCFRDIADVLLKTATPPVLLPNFGGVPLGLYRCNDSNNIANSLGLLNYSIELYADDAKLYSSFYVGARSTDLVKALDSVSEWANMWQLKTAPSYLAMTACTPFVICHGSGL